MIWTDIIEELQPLKVIFDWEIKDNKVSVRTYTSKAPSNRFTIEYDDKHPHLFAVEFFRDHSPQRTCRKLEQHEILWVVRRYCTENT